MLKRWKENRRPADSPNAYVGEIEDALTQQLPANGDGAVIAFEHHILGSIDAPPRANGSAKHSRSIVELERVPGEVSERPFKRRRTDDIEDSIPSGPLPEFADAYELRTAQEDAIADEVERIAATARKQNTVAVVDDAFLKLKCCCTMLIWSYEKERSLPYIGIARRKKFAVVVCDSKGQTPSERAAELADHCGLSIGVYDASSKPTLAYWSELTTRDVIVIDAVSLLESLACGSLAIPQIHFLVVYDAGAIQRDAKHPIRSVMSEYYLITDTLSRPRVFAFLDTPASSSSDRHALERILDATEYSHNNESAKEDTPPSKPSEMVVFYEPNINCVETTLLKRLHSFDPDETVFRSHFRNATLALTDLGPCASDLVWRRALKEIDLAVPHVFNDEDDEDATDTLEGLLARTKANIRNAIKNWVFAMPNLDASSRGYNVSSKLSKLIGILKACEPEGDGFRGVIFVQKRCIAFVLADIIRMLEDQLGFIRPMALSRHGPSLESSNEADVLEGFKTGLYNLLISTKHGEDLDIAPATIVVRFDLFESQVSYAYCRARARERQSHLVHMAERGNDIHRRILLQAAKLDRKLEVWISKVSTSRTSAVPPYPLRETVNPYRSDSEDESDDEGNFVQDPTTSGRIYIQDALTVVYRYASNVPQGRDVPMLPLFEIDTVEGAGGAKANYICTVLLPPEAPIARVSGHPCQSPSQARRSACYQTCVELFNRGLLDYRLFPRQSPSRERDAAKVSAQGSSRNAEKGIPSVVTQRTQQAKPSGVGSYLRKQPDFWPNTMGTMRGCLYPMIFSPVASINDGEGNKYAPMAVLTRMPLPPFAPINVFESGVARKVNVFNAVSVDVDDEKLSALHRYTLRIIRAIMNKPYACTLEKMCYFLAPLPVSWSDPNAGVGEFSLPDITDQIRWNLVYVAADKAMAPLNSQDNQTLAADMEDAVIQDRWVEFTRRYYAVTLRTDLSPMSKPDDSPREKGFENLLEYCKARRKGFPGIQNPNQPLVQVDRLSAVVNNLYPSTQTPPDSKRCPAKYLIPELCARSTISASAYRTSLLLPSLLRRVDDLLLVKELNAKFFDHSIAENHLHAAVSSPSATVEVDYERLELLGDAYLKYLASIYVFVTHPTQSEGALHTIRQRIVSNKALLANASRTGMPQYIQSKPLTPKIWAPPNFYVPDNSGSQKRVSNGNDSGNSGQSPQETTTKSAVGADSETKGQSASEPNSTAEKTSTCTGGATLPVNKQGTKPSGDGGDDNAPTVNAPKPVNQAQKKRPQAEANIQLLGDKCVADVAEAIIGAAYITGGREVALKVTKALNIPVPHIDRWSDFGRRALAPPPEVTAKLRDGSVDQVEKIIGHKVKRPHLLAQALTHTSIQGNEMTCYERLEFIGDAILDFLVIRHIFYRNGTLSPGALTLLKGAMVSNVTLAAVCVSAGLHEHLHYESAALAASIRTYASELKSRQKTEHELAAREHRSPGQYWTEVEPPKALSDVVESIVGAVFLSDSFSPIGAEAVFDKILKPFYDQYITLQTLSQHPTKILLELLQSKGCQNFELLREPISDSHRTMVKCDVLVHDVILARAMDTSAPLSARRACFFALDALEGDPGFMSRTCDCRGTGKKKAKTNLLNIDEDEEMVVEGVLG